MADFEQAFEWIKKAEGGLVNDPVDPGGLTNMGITWGLFKGISLPLLNLAPIHENLINLTVSQAKIIYRRMFWDEMRGDLINSQKIANVIFDSYVNLGEPALKIAQRILSVKDDGVFGRITLLTLNGFREQGFLDKFEMARLNYYENLTIKNPKLKKFLQGWKNRVLRLKNFIKRIK